MQDTNNKEQREKHDDELRNHSVTPDCTFLFINYLS